MKIILCIVLLLFLLFSNLQAEEKKIVKPELVVQSGHTSGDINNIQFSPDGKYIITTENKTNFNTIIIWDAYSRKELLILSKLIKGLKYVKFSNTGKYFLAISDSSFIIFNGLLGSEVNKGDLGIIYQKGKYYTDSSKGSYSYRSSNGKYYFNFSLDDKYLGIAYDRQIKIFEIPTLKEIHTLGDWKKKEDGTNKGFDYLENAHTKEILFFTFTKDNNKIISADCENAILWDIKNAKVICKQVVVDSLSDYQSFALSNNGKYFACIMRKWEFTDKNFYSDSFKRELYENYISFHDSKELHLRKDAYSINIWDVENFPFNNRNIKLDKPCRFMTFCPDNRNIGLIIDENNLKDSIFQESIYLLDFFNSVQTLITKSNYSPNSFSIYSNLLVYDEYWRLKFINTNNLKIKSTLNTNIFYPKILQYIAEEQLYYNTVHGYLTKFNFSNLKNSIVKSNVDFYTLSPNNQYLAYITYGDKNDSLFFNLPSGIIGAVIKVVDLTHNKLLLIHKTKKYPFNFLNFSHNSKMLVFSSAKWLWFEQTDTNNLKMSVYHIENNSVELFGGYNKRICNIEFSKDDQSVIYCGWGESVKIYDFINNKEINSLFTNTYNNDFAICKNGNIIINVMDNHYNHFINIYNMNDFSLLNSINFNNVYLNPIFDINTDNSLYANTYEDTLIVIRDLKNNKIVNQLIGHNNIITDIKFSPKSNILASCSRDGSLILWNVNNGSKIITLFPIDSNDYLITTPDNYYSCTKGGYKAVAFRIGNHAYPFEQYDLRLNRPDIVLSRIGLAPKEQIDAYHDAYLKRLRKMKFKEEWLKEDYNLPFAEINNKDSIEYLYDKEKVTLKIKAIDENYTLDRINVYVNNVPIYGRNGLDVRNKKVKQIQKDVELTLSQGSNKIQVSVLNEIGVESLFDTKYIDYKVKEKKPDLYVITIGISNYEYSKNNFKSIDLKYAHKDANDLCNMFKSQGKFYNQIHIIPILNQDATRENILKLKDTLLKTNPDDVVLISFSGHGLLNDSLDYYLSTYNISPCEPEKNGLAFDELENILDSIPARQKLLFLDACHSGEVDKEDIMALNEDIPQPQDIEKGIYYRGDIKAMCPKRRKKELGTSITTDYLNELFVNLNRGSGTIIISASKGVETAKETPEKQNGLFTFAVLSAFSKDTTNSLLADYDKDGKVTVSELRRFIIEEFDKYREVFKQTPNVRQENYEQDFPIFYN